MSPEQVKRGVSARLLSRTFLHFVGFVGPEYLSATRVWGKPDFYHRWLDVRAEQEFAPGDVVIVASGCKDRRGRPSFNDSAVF